MVSSNAILTTAALLFTSVLGAPLEARQSPTGSFAPSAIFNYDVGNGAILCNPPGGLISKATTNNGHDKTTLLTFTYPAASAGRKCRFAFSLDSAASLSGSKKIDVFTSNSPAPGCTYGWGPGNQRNIHLGRLSASLGADATWDATYNAYLTALTDCKAPGTVEGLELVGVYDNDYVAWNPANGAGARIVYY